MTHNASIILDQVVLVKVEANIYGARKKLKKEDLVLADGSKLPPEDLASLGSKRLLDPEQLAVFNRLKKEAERICLRVGTRFLGGYIIPNVSITQITEELDRIAENFALAKTHFLAGYDAAVNDWVLRHPEFAGIIEKAVDSVEFVSTRLSFDYLVVAITLPDSLPEKERERLDSKVVSLSEQMFYEIAVEANQLIEQSLLGKEQVTRSALRPIKRIRDKLDGLGFLDYRVAPVVITIDDLLSRIPERGAIEGSLLQEILATAMLLADPYKTRRHGEGLLQVQALIPDDEVLETENTAVTATTQTPIPHPNPNPLLSQTGQDSHYANQKNTQSNSDSQATLAPSDPFGGLFDGILEEDNTEVFESETDSVSDQDLVTTEDNDQDEYLDHDHWF